MWVSRFLKHTGLAWKLVRASNTVDCCITMGSVKANQTMSLNNALANVLPGVIRHLAPYLFAEPSACTCTTMLNRDCSCCGPDAHTDRCANSSLISREELSNLHLAERREAP